MTGERTLAAAGMIVIYASIIGFTDNFVRVLAFRGQHEDRQVAAFGTLAQAAADFDARQLFDHPVEDDEVGHERPGLGERGLAVAGRPGLVVLQAEGAAEALFLRDDGLLTEGSFTNLFVPRGDVLVTPPAALGLLPGVLRRSLLESGRAVEGEVTMNDLEAGFFIGNALRGLMPAKLLGA